MRIWLLATFLSASAAANFSLTPKIEKPIVFANNEEIEGSGEFLTGNSLLLSTTTQQITTAESITKLIRKRAADFYNGVIDTKFFSPFNIQRPVIPSAAVLGFGRPLQRGSQLPSTEYVALWTPRGGAPHWGTVKFEKYPKVEGTFIDENRIMNLSDPSMSSAPVRLLQYVGSAESNNFKFAWELARDVDPTTVVTQKKTGLCNPRVAPAIFQDNGFEFLGEADIDNRIMRYVFQGHVNQVDSAHFTNNVYLLTKQRCSCSCQR